MTQLGSIWVPKNKSQIFLNNLVILIIHPSLVEVPKDHVEYKLLNTYGHMATATSKYIFNIIFGAVNQASKALKEYLFNSLFPTDLHRKFKKFHFYFSGMNFLFYPAT